MTPVRAPGGVLAEPMHKLRLTRSDGRGIVLYSRTPIDPTLAAPPAKEGTLSPPSPHLRWHPLRGEWVAYAGYRQARTFLPSSEDDPLARTVDASRPTELPGGDYDVAAFDNKFPTLFVEAGTPPPAIVATRPAKGACEVVVFTDDAESSLGALPLARVELIIDVWADRTRDLGAREDVSYVFLFENRGEEVGVTLHHPHGQIYAYPFIPPLVARQQELQSRYYETSGKGLLADHIAAEVRDGRRMIFESSTAVAFVPVCARYAYEVWIAPRRASAFLGDLDPEERRDLARALKTSLLKLDGLWGKRMPYIMSIYQAPTDGRAHPEAHVHIEIYPALRMPSRLKYLAGSEVGAGVFTADTFPEEKAQELRQVEVAL